MKKQLQSTELLVKEILIKSKAARNSDMILYLEVCKKLNPLAIFLPFKTLILSLGTYGLPPFETVRRSRQKLQAKYIELASDKRIAELRAEEETEYREYARS